MLVWDNKPLIYGGKFFDFDYLKPRYIYLTQTTGGTISANKLSGMSGEIVSLSNTPSAHYVFLNYNATGATLTGNQFEITNNNVSVNGTFSAEPQRRLTLLQQAGGTITANKTYGYSGETATLSYTANSDYYFNGWSTTGGSLNGNVFTWGDADSTAKGNFVGLNPSKLYNNNTTLYIQGSQSKSAFTDANAFVLYMDGPPYNTQSPKFLFTNSSTIANKNFFVLKYKYCRNLDIGNMYWTSTGISQGTYLMRTSQSAISNLNLNYGCDIRYSNALSGSLSRGEFFINSTTEPLYDNNGTKTATTARLYSKIPSGNQFSGYALPLKTYAKHYNHGRNGVYTRTFSGARIGQYEFSITASGKWDYSGYCFEPSAYEDNVWKDIKLVFDMNTYAYSSYYGDELVYKQTNSARWVKTSTALNVSSKLYAIHNINPYLQARWETDWNGTSAAIRSVGWCSAKDVSFTYFDTCEQANQWAKNN